MTPTTPILCSLAILASTAATEPPGKDAPNPPTPTPPIILADFDAASPHTDDHSGRWRTVNDNIMGGRSLGGGQINDGVMVFAGSTNTNGGGFSSIRARDAQFDLTGFDAITARVRADGRTYVLHIDTGLRFANGNVFYRGRFNTQPLINADGQPADPAATAGKVWQTITVPLDAFVPMVRGRTVTGRVEPLDPTKVTGLGLMIDDGLDGPFRLEADWIKATQHAHPENQNG